QVGAFRHDLRQQWDCLRRPFSHERAELRAAEKHGLRLLRRIRISDVGATGRQTLAAKRLPNCCDDRNEPTADFDLVAKEDVAIENDEYAVRRGATLIELEAGGPDGFRSVRADRCDFI